MKFSSKEELTRVYQIVKGLWGSHRTVYSDIAIDTNSLTISFKTDAYFDPVLSILKLKNKGILDVNIEYAGSECDKVIITGCNIDLFEKLATIVPFPDYDSIGKAIDEITATKTKSPLPTEDVVLGNSIILIEHWRKYWSLQGKEGPESVWEIPTPEDLYRAIRS